MVQDADNVNNLLTQIGKLNVQIAETEGGNTTSSQAVGLRDQRNEALSSLAKLMNITTAEQPDGTVSVYSGGDYLVSDGEVRLVKVDTTLGSRPARGQHSAWRRPIRRWRSTPARSAG